MASVNDAVDVITDFESGADLLMIDAVAFGLFDPENPTNYSGGTVSDSDFSTTDQNADFYMDLNTGVLSVNGHGVFDLGDEARLCAPMTSMCCCK